MYRLPAGKQQVLEWEQIDIIVYDIAGEGNTVQYLVKNFSRSYSTRGVEVKEGTSIQQGVV
jgi:hypothetical protein